MQMNIERPQKVKETVKAHLKLTKTDLWAFKPYESSAAEPKAHLLQRWPAHGSMDHINSFLMLLPPAQH